MTRPTHLADGRGPAEQGRSGERLEPQAAFAEMGRIDLRHEDLQQVLQRIAELAKRTIPGADEVSISLVRGGQGTTPAYTGQLAMDCDETQFGKGDGPCLNAAEAGDLALIADMAAEERWPDYPEHAAAAGCGSSLSLGLPMQEAVTGAMNVYATKPHAFDEAAVGLARTFPAGVRRRSAWGRGRSHSHRLEERDLGAAGPGPGDDRADTLPALLALTPPPLDPLTRCRARRARPPCPEEEDAIRRWSGPGTRRMRRPSSSRRTCGGRRRRGGSRQCLRHRGAGRARPPHSPSRGRRCRAGSAGPPPR